MVLALVKEPSPRLLKHVVRCYLRLSDNARYLIQHSLNIVNPSQPTILFQLTPWNLYLFYSYSHLLIMILRLKILHFFVYK